MDIPAPDGRPLKPWTKAAMARPRYGIPSKATHFILPGCINYLLINFLSQAVRIIDYKSTHKQCIQFKIVASIHFLLSIHCLKRSIHHDCLSPVGPARPSSDTMFPVKHLCSDRRRRGGRSNGRSRMLAQGT